ncbi:MAG: hypothetical protein HRU19_10110 [Pseudobacteriovorax sp.]|nr:hypothetical protein [Pseudobacteriovorax sp.]
MKFLRLLSFIIFTLSCGEVIDKRTSETNSEDVEAVTGETPFYMTLPDRADYQDQMPDIFSSIDQFVVTLSPEGDSCTVSEPLTYSGTYVDGFEISENLSRSCDYQVTVSFGKASETTLAIQKVSYEQNIKPLIDEHCLACHEDYTSYESIEGIRDNIVFQVENKTMPTEDDPPLTEFEIATFIAWRAFDFPNEDPDKISDDSPLKTIQTTYYRNNFNEYIYSFQLQNNSFVIYDASVWLQPDGENAGWPVIEIPLPTPEVNQNEDEKNSM